MRARCATGMSLGPFTWQDLEAWERRARIRLEPFELAIFERLDSLLLESRRSKKQD